MLISTRRLDPEMDTYRIGTLLELARHLAQGHRRHRQES